MSSILADQRTDDLIAAYKEHFGAEPTHISSGPGRVNLIGEHTDYNEGFVLPVALKRDVRFAFRPRDDRQVRLFSLEYGETYEFDLDSFAFNDAMLWANYVQGTAWSLEQLGIPLTGMDAALSGNVPRGSGLSSSAAVEVGAAHAFLAGSGQLGHLSGPQIARAAQRAENEYVGVNCGIMDQFISVLGRENHALLIDCRSLTYELIPMPAEASLVIGNTRASRSLASSAYNERRQECETGPLQRAHRFLALRMRAPKMGARKGSFLGLSSFQAFVMPCIQAASATCHRASPWSFQTSAATPSRSTESWYCTGIARSPSSSEESVTAGMTVS